MFGVQPYYNGQFPHQTPQQLHKEIEQKLHNEIDHLKSDNEHLKIENEHLKSNLSFLVLQHQSTFPDVVLLAISDHSSNHVPIPAHKAVLGSRSPVFKVMLENEMKETLSGTIKISDVSYNTLNMFVNYMYTAEICLDEKMAFELLAFADKYQVLHLKTYCEEFIISKLNWDNSLLSFEFAHQHNAMKLIEEARSLILGNMEKLIESEKYKELLKRDQGLVIEIYEAYLSKQISK